MAPLTDDVVQTIQSAAKLLTGSKRRQFQAAMAHKYCRGSARQAETTFGRGRAAVDTGLHELRSGIRCVDAVHLRGRKRSEELCPQLEDHVHRLVDPQAQADPKFPTPLAFPRITAKAVRDARNAEPAVAGFVPSRQTVGQLLHRLGYRLRRVLKTRPEKNSRNGRDLPERPGRPRPRRRRTGHAENLHRYRGQSQDRRLRARRRSPRGAEPVQALDRDMAPEAILVPFGILELNRGPIAIHQPTFIFGHS